MTETKTERWHRAAVLTFMAAVTIGLLALVFAQAGRGAAGLMGTLVYGLAAGFGLEFVGSAWSGRWRRTGDGRQLQS